MFDKVTGYLEKALKSRQQGSAVTPLLWMNGLVTVPCLGLFAWIAEPRCYFFMVIAVFMIGFTAWEYRALRKQDPRLVQSERLQYELAKLDFVASKGGAVVFDPVTIEFGTDPLSFGNSTTDDGGEQ